VTQTLLDVSKFYYAFMALTESLADQIARDVASQIIDQTKKEGKPEDYLVPKQNWEKIVRLIVTRVFAEIKSNAVVELDPTVLSPSNNTLVSAAPGSPLTGALSTPNKITGKIT